MARRRVVITSRNTSTGFNSTMKFVTALTSFLLFAGLQTSIAFTIGGTRNVGSKIALENTLAFTPSNLVKASSSALDLAWVVDEEANTLTVTPIKNLNGIVTLPGSKSLSNRCLLLAALSNGKTKVENLLESDDIRFMLDALDQMKVPVERDPSDPTTVTVTGQGGPINAPSDEVCELFLGNAGTAMRPLAAALCMGEGKFVLDGVPRMRERPIADLIDGLKQLGADVTCVEETGCPPVTINANGLSGGNVSNQKYYCGG